MSGGSNDEPGDGTNPLGGLLERARPDASFAANQSLQSLQARLFGRTAQTTMVGRYTLGPRLGAGGGGTVYRGLDTESGRTVALKLLVSDARGGSARARLLREAQSLAKLQHPNIVEFHEVGTFDPGVVDPHAPSDGDNGVFLAMELVEGDNLAVWAETERPWQQVRDVFVAAGRGLAHAHARGFAHRDFKPSNVLVGDDGRVRVADFGLARVTRELTAPLPGVSVRLVGESSLPGLHISLTKPGAVIGTPAYMAPEQHLSSRADARSDQFSFCLALYESLYRHSPFVGSTPGKILEAKLRGMVAPPPSGSKVPSRIHRALVRGLAPDPAARHPSMDALLEALEDDGGVPTTARVIAAIGAAAAIVAVLAWLSIRLWMRDPCEAVPATPAGWSPAIAEAILEASGGLAVGHASSTVEHVRDDLERYAARWADARTESCEPSVRDRVQPRLSCLDERARLLTATTDALREPTPHTLEHATAATAALPDPTACLGEPAPRWFDADALDDDEAAALRDELARVTIAVALQRADAAMMAEQLLAHAQAIEHRELVPRARLLLARALLATAPAAAAAALLAAHDEAQATGDPALARHVAATGLELAVVRNDPTAARSWSDRLAGDEPTADPEVHARAELAAAELGELLPDAAAATLAHCREAAAITEAALPVSPIAARVAERCTMLALATGRTIDALSDAERAGALAEEVWGSDHPLTALARIRFATALFAAQRRDAALTQARTGLDLLERGTHSDDGRRIGALLLLAELERDHDLTESGRLRGIADALAQLDDVHRIAHAEASFAVALGLADRNRALELAELAEARARRIADGARLVGRIDAWRRRGG